MKQINLHEPGPGAQPGLAPKPYCVIGSGSWTCHEHPLCFSLLIPTEITASLLPPAIGKTVKFAHTKCLQQRLALCCHFSWDSDTSLMFNLVFFFFLMSVFPGIFFCLFLGDRHVKWSFPTGCPTTPHFIHPLPHTSLAVQWYGTGQSDPVLFISAVSGSNTGAPPCSVLSNLIERFKAKLP